MGLFEQPARNTGALWAVAPTGPSYSNTDSSRRHHSPPLRTAAGEKIPLPEDATSSQGAESSPIPFTSDNGPHLLSGQLGPIELIAGAAQFVSRFVGGIFDGDLAAVGPNQKHLLSVMNLTRGEDGDPLLRSHGDSFRKPARGGKEDEGAGIPAIRVLLDAEDDLAGLGVAECPGATDQGRGLRDRGRQAGRERNPDSLPGLRGIADRDMRARKDLCANRVRYMKRAQLRWSELDFKCLHRVSSFLAAPSGRNA